MSDFTGRATAALRRATGNAASLAPGLVEAGLSSLAGFVASLYAVRSLHGADLGAFSLYLAASTVASLIPQQLLFLPAQIAALEAPRDERASLLRTVLPAGALIGVLVAPIPALAGLIVAGEVSTPTLIALGSGAAVAVVLTPLQDHVRSTLYLAGRASQAAVVSGLQLALTATVIVSLDLADVPAAWIPFAAVSAGAAGSIVWGLAVTGRGRTSTASLPRSRALMRSGSALLPAALLQEATVLASSALLAAVGSAVALGQAEAARIVARPVQVLSLGASRALAPPLMEAGRDRSSARARSTGALYILALTGSGIAYMAIAGWPHALNPFVRLVPAAYDVEGLVALVLLATLVGAIASLPRAVLLGARREQTLLVIAAIASVIRLVAVVLLATSLGAYALPLGQLVSVVVSGGLGARAAVAALDRR